MKLDTIAIGVLALSLTGCGTLNTVFQDDATTSYKLRQQKTYCESISRVYSGVAYDFCSLNAPPVIYPSPQEKHAVPLIAVDMALSGVLDTLVLPYTIYQQNKYGSMEIKGQK